MKDRDPVIDFLKFVAVLCIFNAHSTVMYPVCPWLATGGTIGDALFFFCSGYTLLMDNCVRLCRFDNWYKRRLARLWPSCLAWAVLASLALGRNISVLTAFKGIGWFVSCILVYYVVIWLIGTYARRWMTFVFCSAMVLSTLGAGAYLYGAIAEAFYFKMLLFFPVMLVGSWVGMRRREQQGRLSINLLIMLLLAVVVSGCVLVGTRYSHNALLRYVYLATMPLSVLFVLFAYRTASIARLERFTDTKAWTFVLFTGGLCLDFYFVKWSFVTGALNFMFPLNIPVLLLYLLGIAYVNRCLARTIQQTLSMEKSPYDWRAVFRP